MTLDHPPPGDPAMRPILRSTHALFVVGVGLTIAALVQGVAYKR